MLNNGTHYVSGIVKFLGYNTKDEKDFDFIQRVAIEERVLKQYKGSLRTYNEMLSSYERMKHGEWIDINGVKRHGVMGEDLKDERSEDNEPEK